MLTWLLLIRGPLHVHHVDGWLTWNSHINEQKQSETTSCRGDSDSLQVNWPVSSTVNPVPALIPSCLQTKSPRVRLVGLCFSWSRQTVWCFNDPAASSQQTEKEKKSKVHFLSLCNFNELNHLFLLWSKKQLLLVFYAATAACRLCLSR